MEIENYFISNSIKRSNIIIINFRIGNCYSDGWDSFVLLFFLVVFYLFGK